MKPGVQSTQDFGHATSIMPYHFSVFVGFRKSDFMIYLPNGETSKSECGRMIGIN